MGFWRIFEKWGAVARTHSSSGTLGALYGARNVFSGHFRTLCIEEFPFDVLRNSQDCSTSRQKSPKSDKSPFGGLGAGEPK